MPQTLVTVLFDLPKRNPECRRTMEWLIENGLKVLALEHPMVIFTEKHLVGRLLHERAIRDLFHQTHIVIMDFEELPHYKEWKSQEGTIHLIENRGANDHLDNFMINWEKPGLIARVANENPFGTTHIGWINLGIQNVKVFNEEGWEDAFDPTDKVRIHQQRYLHRIVDYPQFYKWGWCSTAGGFLAGSVERVIEFAGDFYREFERAMSMGFAPGDEDINGTLLVRNPEKYTVSYGDYGQLLCNAKRLRRGGGTFQWQYGKSLYWMINEALTHGNIEWAAHLWYLIMDSARDGYFKDDTAPIAHLEEMFK